MGYLSTYPGRGWLLLRAPKTHTHIHTRFLGNTLCSQRDSLRKNQG